jgi:HEAT repeat protein
MVLWGWGRITLIESNAMRSTFVTVLALFASLALAAPLPAQVRQSEITPKAPGSMSLTDVYRGKTLSQWVKQISDRDPSLSEEAIRAVATFGPDAAKEANPALIDALSYRDTGLRVNAALAITLIGVHENHVNRAVPALARRLSEDNQAIVRLHAAVALGRLDLDARPAIPQLVQAAKDPAAWEIRRAAVYALGRAGRATREKEIDMGAAKALIFLFSPSQEYCAEVRLMAVMALGSMGIPPSPVDKQAIIQAFNQATTDRYKAVAIWAHMGMMADGEPLDIHMKAILGHLKGTDFEAHLQALRALGTMKDKARSAIPELTTELKGKEPVLVAAACWALGEMGDIPDKPMQLIQELKDSKDSDDTVKNAAKDALEKLTGRPKGRD